MMTERQRKQDKRLRGRPVEREWPKLISDTPESGADALLSVDVIAVREDKSGKPAWDAPSQAPGFEGATPQALAKALFRPLKKSTD
jgi:hypothetical protein